MSIFNFINVGRGKQNWTAEIDTEQPDEDVAYDFVMEIKKNGGLASKGIDVEFDNDYNGKIYAGFHKVGTFKIQEAA